MEVTSQFKKFSNLGDWSSTKKLGKKCNLFANSLNQITSSRLPPVLQIQSNLLQNYFRKKVIQCQQFWTIMSIVLLKRKCQLSDEQCVEMNFYSLRSIVIIICDKAKEVDIIEIFCQITKLGKLYKPPCKGSHFCKKVW